MASMVAASGRAWSSAQNLLSNVSKEKSPTKAARSTTTKVQLRDEPKLRAQHWKKKRSKKERSEPSDCVADLGEKKKRRLSVGLWVEDEEVISSRVDTRTGETVKGEDATFLAPSSSRIRSLSGSFITSWLSPRCTSGTESTGSGLLIDASIETREMPEERGRKRTKKKRKHRASISVQLGDLKELRRSRSRSSSRASEEDSEIRQDGSPQSTHRERLTRKMSISGAAVDMSPRSKGRMRRISKATVSYGALPLERRVTKAGDATSEPRSRRANSLSGSPSMKLKMKSPLVTTSASTAVREQKASLSPRSAHFRQALSSFLLSAPGSDDVGEIDEGAKQVRVRVKRKGSRKNRRSVTHSVRQDVTQVLEGFLTKRPSMEDLREKNILVDPAVAKRKQKSGSKLAGLLRMRRKKDLTSWGYQSSDEDLMVETKTTSQSQVEKTMEMVYREGLIMDMADLDLISQIGEGAYSEVFVGKYQHALVAVKRLRTTKHTMKAFYRELDCLLRFRHMPTVVTLLGVVMEPCKCLVLEYAPCGSLYNVIHTKQTKFSVSHALGLALQVATGMRDIHGSHILHRDLTLPNILYLNDKAVIADFGIARHESCNKGLPDTYSPIGHQRYRAPEVSMAAPYNSKADVYTFGTVLYELVTGQQAWQDVGDKQVAALQKGGNTPIFGDDSSCPSDIQKLVYQCWSFKPKARPSFKEVVKVLQEANCRVSRQ